MVNRASRTATVALLVAAALSGCSPTLTPEDLGTVEYKVPKLQGSEIPFPMPELEPAAGSEQSASPDAAEPPAIDQPKTEPAEKN
jgi:hypothetical protein